MHMAVAILRVEKGLDYSRLLGEDNEKQTVAEEQRIIQPNDSTTDLLTNSQVHGSNESLSRNASQGTFIDKFEEKNTLAFKRTHKKYT